MSAGIAATCSGRLIAGVNGAKRMRMQSTTQPAICAHELPFRGARFRRRTVFSIVPNPRLSHLRDLMRIVIADDDTFSRTLTRLTLERSGYEVIAVENGRLAMDRLSGPGAPRLALLDWVMPGMDGPDVCRAIRARPDRSYIYIVLLTSKESKADLVAGLEAGADDYLTKPCHYDELMARLRTGQRILDLQDRLVFDARHDSLTLLPNRAGFMDRLARCVDRAKKNRDYRFAVLFVDLDRFKSVNAPALHDVLEIPTDDNVGPVNGRNCDMEGIIRGSPSQYVRSQIGVPEAVTFIRCRNALVIRQRRVELAHFARRIL